MTQRGSLSTTTVFALVLFVVAPSALVAQDPAEALKQAYSAMERGHNDEALTKLNEVLAKDPSAEDAYTLRNSLDAAQWARLQVQNGQIAAAVEALFKRARPAAMAKTADQEAIKKLLDDARTGDFAAREKALVTLAANHGDYAVAQLWRELGASETERRVTAMLWIRKLGSDAALPLTQVLKADDTITRMNAATMLGLLKDVRGVPYLAAAAERDAEPSVKSAASEALGKIGASNSGYAAKFLELADRFYKRDSAVVNPYRTQYPVWAFVKDGDSSNLVAREVPRDLYHLKLAETALYDLLALDPTNEDGVVALTSVLLAEAEFGRDLKAEGDEAPVAAATGAARMIANVGGPAILDKVIAKAMADGRSDVAAAAVKLLGGLLSVDTLPQSSGMAMALAAPHKAVRFAAALAVAGIGPRSAFPGSDQVVPALAEALGQDAVRNVLVIDDNADTRNRIAADLNAKHYFAAGVDNGAVGVARLREYPIEDIVVVRYNLGGGTHVSEVLAAIRRDPRTEKTPVVMIVDAADAEAAKAQYEGKVQGWINTPPVGDAYEPALRALVTSLDAGREAATLTAAAAASALAKMDPRGGVLAASGATSALLSTLKGDDRVRGPAIAALGNIGDPAAVAGLVELVRDTTAAEPLRGAACVALARIGRAAGTVTEDAKNALWDSVRAGGSNEFMTMLAQAAGIAPIAPQTRANILRMAREKVTIDLVK